MDKVNTLIEDWSSQLIDELTLKGYSKELADRIASQFKQFIRGIVDPLKILSYNDLVTVGKANLVRHFKEDVDRGIKRVVSEMTRDYLFYLRAKKEIVEIYQETKDWGEVLNRAVYQDSSSAEEAFIDYIEEVCQVKVKDVKHLQKLTGIYYLNPVNDKGEVTELPIGGDESKQEAIKELGETLTGAKYAKYSRALQVAIQSGAKYKDLLQIKPKDYGLPESWSGNLGKDQYSSILWAISWEFYIREGAGGLSLMKYPSLRLIAEELDAPYSVIMDAYKKTK